MSKQEWISVASVSGRRGTGYIHPGGRLATKRLVGALALEHGQIVLELGCGTGATLVELAARLPLRLIGLDLLPEMLVAARRRLAQDGAFVY